MVFSFSNAIPPKPTRSWAHLGSLPEAQCHLTQPAGRAPPPGPDSSQHKYLSWFPNPKPCSLPEPLAWPRAAVPMPYIPAASLVCRTAPDSSRSVSRGPSSCQPSRPAAATRQARRVRGPCQPAAHELPQAHLAPHLSWHGGTAGLCRTGPGNWGAPLWPRCLECAVLPDRRLPLVTWIKPRSGLNHDPD